MRSGSLICQSWSSFRVKRLIRSFFSKFFMLKRYFTILFNFTIYIIYTISKSILIHLFSKTKPNLPITSNDIITSMWTLILFSTCRSREFMSIRDRLWIFYIWSLFIIVSFSFCFNRHLKASNKIQTWKWLQELLWLEERYIRDYLFRMKL